MNDPTSNHLPSRAEGRPLAIVTGASAGLGEEFARQLSRRGISVLAVARRAERLEALAARAQSEGTAAIHPLPLDVTEVNAARRIRDRARELGGASWLVNNAGFGAYGSFEGQSGERLGSMVRLNCEAVVELVAEVLPDMRARGRGVILNVASTAAFQPTPFFTVYGATKAFVLSFSEGLAEELRGTGVTVTALCPGPIPTEFQQVAVQRRSQDGSSGGTGETLPALRGSMDAKTCVAIGLAAAERGQAIVVPGAFNRLTTWVSQLAPRGMVRRIAAKMMDSRKRMAQQAHGAQ